MLLPAEIIKKKRNNLVLTSEEIEFFINSYTQGKIPDYQMSALLMAIYFNGMSPEESVALTSTMLHSGITVDTSSIPGFKVDKHSTGGVGDKTSLILGPVVAAAGVYVPMISGRGLGHTGGTLDKLESIPGFNTQQSLEKFIEITKKIGTCFIGQTKDICPADKKIYALRDVTATVESFPLICASIMSKKIAEGIDGLVLDVKYGTGAFMKSAHDAELLAKDLIHIAKSYGKKITALITSMNQPLGRYAGNVLEVVECVEIMQNKTSLDRFGRDLYEDTRELSLQLSAHMIHLSGKTNSLEEAYTLAKEMLVSGKALEVFKKMCREQGGDLNGLVLPKQKRDVLAPKSGYISSFNVEKVGIAGILLHAGRRKAEDTVNPTSGIEFHVKIGDQVKEGDVIYTILGDEPELFDNAHKTLTESFEIHLQKPADHVLIENIIT
ncbi:thymidine phosphorylase [Pseudobdellovibrio exovorus]|uniref:thymidine phosphorylase n=1 Tax=Pseudobdellovibrio exovorus JSS TaxID=1184267 RepID=M4VC07_9BACT|nr:thymidine phosphorylase [Pseudobdellovibrio exovorus]AGH96773.1 pyrimidine-nucleoside phosphorylase [Pseudobdellovibrio exovorus JSS]